MGLVCRRTLTDCSMLSFCEAKSKERWVVREEGAQGRGGLSRGTGSAHNHLDDVVDCLLHIEIPGWLQAGGSEVAAVGMVRGNDVETLVLGVGSQSKNCRHSCRMCPGDLHPPSSPQCVPSLRCFPHSDSVG